MIFKVYIYLESQHKASIHIKLNKRHFCCLLNQHAMYTYYI